MKDILHVITNFENGAVPSILLDLAPEFENRGFRPRFLALEKIDSNQDSVKRCLSKGYQLDSLNKGPKETWTTILALKQYLKKSPPDLVHTHLGRADVYTALAKKKELPMVATFHSVRRNFNKLTLMGMQFTDNRVGYRTGVSQAVIDSFYSDGFLASPHRAVYNPVWEERLVPRRAVEEVRQSLDLNGRWPVLVNVGRFIEAKGQRYLFDALPEILKEFPDAVLIMAGSGELEAPLKNQAQTLGIESALRWVGFYGHVPDILQVADLVIFPSVWEGLGLVPIESLLMGKKVISSRIPAVTEYFGKDHPWLFEAQNSQAILEVAKKALMEQPAMEELVQRVRKLFNPKVIAGDYAEIYETLLKASLK